VTFIDEAYFNPSSRPVGFILREEGTRYNKENVEERGAKEGNQLHVAGWCNWYEKCEELRFYNDEEEYIKKLKRPTKPRTRMYEEKEEFNQRIRE
jgi:hypothetical protein